MALGADRVRIARQAVTESCALAFAGGALGLVLAVAGIRALVAAYPTTLPRTDEVGLDVTVLIFTVGVATLTGLVFGVAPMMHTRLTGLAGALKDGGERGSTGGARHHVRRGLVTAASR